MKMQKLTLHYSGSPIDQDEKKHITAKFNIGQKVYVIDYSDCVPTILESYILAIGIESIFQIDNLIYIIDRLIKNNDFKKYYEKDIHSTRSEAAKSLIRRMKKQTNILREMLKHPYYKNEEKQ